MLQDPTGGFFHVWQAKKHTGAGVVNEPGAFDWFELTTKDPAKAAAFYGKLFGWTSEVLDMGSMKYTMCSIGGSGVAGIMTDPQGQAPTAWCVYINVKDVDGTVRNAKESGGRVIVPPTDVPNMVRFSVLTDPQGVYFGVAKSLQG